MARVIALYIPAGSEAESKRGCSMLIRSWALRADGGDDFVSCVFVNFVARHLCSAQGGRNTCGIEAWGRLNQRGRDSRLVSLFQGIF